jgi:hypothetical protein
MLWEIVVSANWRFLTPEYIALAICAFVAVAILIWTITRISKRIETIETLLSKMQSEITTILQVQTALIMKMNPNYKVEIDPRGAAAEMNDGDIAGQATSAATTSSQSEIAKSSKLAGHEARSGSE